MPRSSDSKQLAAHFYHSQLSNSHHNNLQFPTDATVHVPPLTLISQASHHHTSSAAAAPASKKKHICPTCDRAFTTSGHLARHSRVHTGERNHKCPFPGCETRCSRQDNLQQHYRIHLSPGSRRSSTRSAIARAMNNSTQPISGSNRRASTSSSSADSASLPPLSGPPALEPARAYSISTPPDSPPALAQATLPATAHPPPESVSSRSSSSPEISYSPIAQHHSQGMPITPGGHPQTYSHYRSGTTTYQEQSQGAGFTYVHTTPISHPSSTAGSHVLHGTSFSYSNPHSYENPTHQPSQEGHNSPSPSSTHNSSRHSISHISHPQSYSQNQAPSTAPPSPASSHSHPSGPTTPSYTVFHDDTHAYHGNGMLMDHNADQTSLSASSHVGPHLAHSGYSTLPMVNGGLTNRFGSPPPILAPIQDERVMRGDQRQIQLHTASPLPYLHHPQPLGPDYQYQPLSYNSLRNKGVGALVQ